MLQIMQYEKKKLWAVVYALAHRVIIIQNLQGKMKYVDGL